jgi:predicted glycogen debranching enzyme
MPTDLSENTSVDLPQHRIEFTPGSPDPDRAALEWVLADAQGGFAMGCADATPMRRYHGLLVASLSPPVRRVLMLSSIDEHLHIPWGDSCGCHHDTRLTRFHFEGDDHRPAPPPTLAGFTKGVGTCVWDHTIPSQVGSVRIRKTLTLLDRCSACRIDYAIESAILREDLDEPMTLTLSPLVAMRDFHELNHPGTLAPGVFSTEPIEEPGVEGVRVRREGIDADLLIRGVHLHADRTQSMWHGVRYEHDSRRGQSDTEDLFCPLRFRIQLSPRSTTHVSIEVELGEKPSEAAACEQRRSMRVRSSIDSALRAAADPQDQQVRDTIACLASAADDFVVDRAFPDAICTSIIAGYPWFSDWGRDTMICVPGLLLTTGRFDEAHACLTTFARAREHGLIPNRFDDDAGPAHFNTVDAPLWFVHACRSWSVASGKPLDRELIDACDDILDAYAHGTINKIAMDPHDGLIRAGDAQTQLTWMDALRDEIAFTPRHGKPIEINALWINALRARVAMGTINDIRAAQLQGLATQAERSIVSMMTGGPHGGLVDCLIPHSAVRSFSWQRSDECRPNQVFATALPGINLPEHIGRDTLHAIERHLLTPAGLRTLSADHPEYAERYAGSMIDRDRAYHNGTVWPWLIGAYADTKLRVNNFDQASCGAVTDHLLRLASVMDTDGVGSIHEIYDAEPGENEKHAPQGCPAQAWSIAEVLRGLVLATRGRA